MPADTVADLLRDAQRDLSAAGIETAALDARLLLQAAAGLRHDEIIASPRLIIADAAGRHFAALLVRRLNHEPVSRILGEREFYGRSFRVTPATLDPRPDTETLVEEALALLPPDSPARVLDLGTGTGAIIISILAERPLVSGVAVDHSAAALAVASTNADRHGVQSRLDLHKGSWLAGVSGKFDLIVSNPPYIPAGEINALAPEVCNHDPRLALCGGEDGLEAYRQIALNTRGHLAPHGRISVEIGAGQKADLVRIFLAEGFSLFHSRPDLSGTERVLTFHST